MRPRWGSGRLARRAAVCVVVVLAVGMGPGPASMAQPTALAGDQAGPAEDPHAGPLAGSAVDARSASLRRRATPADAFVRALYADFLVRVPTNDEMTFLRAVAGGAVARGELARTAATSAGGRAVVVQRLYADTLGRPGDAVGVVHWTHQIGAGGSSVAELASRLLASDEYFRGPGGGNDRSWVASLYRKVLGRTAEVSALDHWAGQIPKVGRPRAAMVLFESSESRRRRVTTLYQRLLGHSPDPAGADYWSGRVGRDGDLVLAASLAATPAYLARAQVRYAGPQFPERLFVTVPNAVGAPTPCATMCLADRSSAVQTTEGTLAGDAITVDPDRRYQTIDGFGFAMTDTAAYLIDQVPNDQGQRDALLRRLFDPEQGIGVSWVRIVVAASDYTVVPRPWYSYRPTEADPFDIGRARPGSPRGDLSHIVPVLQAAVRASRGEITFFANPHSAPGWMKGNGDMWNIDRDGCLLGYCANSRRDLRNVYAQYLVDFVKAYQAHGIPISALGVQNEPNNLTDYPGGNLTPVDELEFINRLKLVMRAQRPALAQEVWAEIGSWEATCVLSEGRNAGAVDGLSYHCYFYLPVGLEEFHAAFPDKSINQIECTQDLDATWPKTIDVLIQSAELRASVVANWNIALDSGAGPSATCRSTSKARPVDRAAVGRPSTCAIHGSRQTAPVVVSGPTGRGVASFTREYYEMGHFSKFVRPGAVRIGSTGVDSVGSVAFENPDGSRALVVHNRRQSRVSLAVNVDPGHHLQRVDLPPDAIATFIW